jgi:Putative prokaryotic signal transducing protein
LQRKKQATFYLHSRREAASNRCRKAGGFMPDDRENAATDAEAEAGVEEELVEVFDTQQESEAMVVRSLLQSTGIEALLISLEAQQDVLPGVGGVVVRVRASQADEARRIIADYRQDGGNNETEPPIEDSAA